MSSKRSTSSAPRITRRGLLSAGAGLMAATALPEAGGSVAAAARPTQRSLALLPEERIGIQLYTVRDQIQNHGFAHVFKNLSQMGFREVEFAGYTQGTGPISMKQLRGLLDDFGLRAIGCHSGASVSTIDKALDDAAQLGMPYIGIADAPNAVPLAPKSTWQKSADDMNAMGAKAKARGMQFYWHNHSSEFTICGDSPTERAYDILLAETDPKLVAMEMDIYWAFVGQFEYGQAPLPTFNPVDYVVKNPTRYPLFHVKDGKRNQLNPEGYDIVDVGQGHIDFETFFHTIGHKRSHHYINENDNAGSHPRGSLTSARCSYGYMHAMV